MEPSPFIPGSKLQFRDKEGRDLIFAILKGFEPFTRAQAVLAHCATLSPDPLVVKIFDPRYFHERFDDLYNNDLNRPWTLQAEASAVADREPLLRGERRSLPEELEEDEPSANEPQKVAHRAARWEKHFQMKMRSLYETELAAYSRLQPLWGTAVPELLTHGNYLSPEPRYIPLHAIVIEYIGGTTFYSTPVPAITPSLVAQFSRILQQLPLFGVMHGDPNMGNVILDFTTSPPRTVLIDFGQAILRQAHQTPEDWDRNVKGVHEWPGAVHSLLKLKRIPWQTEFEVPFYKLYPL